MIMTTSKEFHPTVGKVELKCCFLNKWSGTALYNLCFICELLEGWITEERRMVIPSLQAIVVGLGS